MLTAQSYLKAAGAGLLAGIIMFIPMMILVEGLGVAPFNIPPSAAFASVMGINFAPFVPPALHFGYGILWALIFLAVFEAEANITKAIGMSVVMWLILMVVYAPFIGWGFFGFGGPAHGLPADHPLHLGNPVKFMVVTLVMHLIYAVVLGWAVKSWTKHERRG